MKGLLRFRGFGDERFYFINRGFGEDFLSLMADEVLVLWTSVRGRGVAGAMGGAGGSAGG